MGEVTAVGDDGRTVLTTDLALPEGPLLLPDGRWLVTELDVERGTVTEVLADGSRRPLAKTGRPNGLALTADGAVWVAESLDPAVIRLELSGEFTRALDQVEGESLLWPNDLCVGPDGAIYVTDSGILVGDFLIEGRPREGVKELPVDGRIFRFDPRSGEANFIDRGLQFTNGIAFGPDGMLYANETYTGDVFRYRIEDGAVVGEKEPFANVLDPDYDEQWLRGPDGMAFSADGRLWVAVFGQGDVTILAPDGSVEGRIQVPGQSPTNIAFGPPGDQRIYIVEDEHGSMEARPAGVDGLPLHS
jgi:gluconolactonase